MSSSDNSQLVSPILIRRIMIYPLANAIHSLNKQMSIDDILLRVTHNGGQNNLGLCEKALPSNCYVGLCN